MSILEQPEPSKNGSPVVSPAVSSTQTGELGDGVPTELVQFLGAIFDPNDIILIRPIEIWTEGGRRRSRTDYEGTRHLPARTLSQNLKMWQVISESAAKGKTNLFFGVCPRFKSWHDQAWQIRRVRVLWADLDNCTVEDALLRCEANGVPRPSVIVRSGNGVHLYWLLDSPYLIDDTGDPARVNKEFHGPGKKPREYIDMPDGKVYRHLDDAQKQLNPLWPKVSPKGEAIQHILAGIASKIGGDATQDLSRLLRLPGTLNRKNERVGNLPTSCTLVECDPARRYPLSTFEVFAKTTFQSADVPVSDEEAEKVRLPHDKKLTQRRRATLDGLVNICAVAPVGTRSGADFNLCCWVIEHGIGKEEVWSIVQSVGKFQERGREYFDRTWASAEKKVRIDIAGRAKERATRATTAAGPAPPSGAGGATTTPKGTGPSSFQNYHWIRTKDGEGIEEVDSIHEITRKLALLAPGWPKRVDSTLFAEASNHEPLWLLTTDDLFAWIDRQTKALHKSEVDWKSGSGMVTQPRFFASLRQTADNFEGVEAFPHHPLMPRHWYMHQPPPPSTGRALQDLLAQFCPATPLDGDLILAFALTLFWGGKPGQRPAWLITSEADGSSGRGSGKSSLVKMMGRLVGGHLSISPDEGMDKLMPRLLSPAAIQRRIALLDNVKSLRFSWSELEALVTTDVISGKKLYVGEGRRPNLVTWCITLNGANLSCDLAQRCVIVKLKQPCYSATWEDDTTALIEAKRWEIIADLLAILQAPATTLTQHSRWGAWEDAILARVPEPADCQRLILERQAEIDADGSEAAMVLEHFERKLKLRGHNPEEEAVWIPSKLAAEFTNEATGEHRPTNKANAYLATLELGPRLKKSDRGSRGWLWRGKDCPPDRSATHIGLEEEIELDFGSHRRR